MSKMMNQISKSILKLPFMIFRCKSTSAEYVASRFRDPTFEKLMDKYKNLLKVIAIQDLIVANPNNNPPYISIEFLDRLSQKLHLNRGATYFLRKYPHIFHIFYDTTKAQPLCKLTDLAIQISRDEAEAISGSLPIVIDRLVRLLAMSVSKTLPLRAIFKIWRELGLPDDFEDSVVSSNADIFRLSPGNEPNTHTLELVKPDSNNNFAATIEDWRVLQYCGVDNCNADKSEIQFSFKHQFPPGMRLSQNFKAKVKEWQRVPYIGPYEDPRRKKGSKSSEKRAVAVVHEVLSLTVEKMIEVEKISHFRKWFGIDLNIRDLFLDHPGIFYLSTKGKRHTVFLREAYERGGLIEPNSVYLARRKLLDLVLLGRHGLITKNVTSEEGSLQEARKGQKQAIASDEASTSE